MTAVDSPRARHGVAPSRPVRERPERRGGRHLKPVDRSRPLPTRRPGAPVLVGTGIVIVALFALAAMHALLIGGQLRLDDAERAMASETEEIRKLRLRVAELESPGRVLEVARDRLGMVEPSEVGYLLPASVDTGDDAPIRVAPAELPPPPEPEPVATVSAEQAEVDAAVDGDDPDVAEADSVSETDQQADQQTDADTSPSADGSDAAPDAPVAGGGDE